MSKLYLIPTPIGNLKDITFRAIELLKEVNMILSEDTRKSNILLQHYKINKKLYSYHIHNEHKTLQSVIKQLESSKTVALLTDAGTPSISDPGFLLVRECIRKNIEVECLPGATAFIPALVNSGLPSDRFCFEGFLPHKKGRNNRLEMLEKETRSVILYEAPHRLLKTINDLIKHLGKERKASISRELTKIYEETVRGTLSEIYSYFKSKKIKGEFVIVVAGKN